MPVCVALRTLLASLGLTAALSGCNFVPSGGPSDSVIAASAASAVTSPYGGSGINYALVDINQRVLSGMPQGSSQGSQSLSIGDILEITIFEAKPGGLFIPEAGARPGNFITLPRQMIDPAGRISIPYGGQIAAAGRSVVALQNTIQGRLARVADEPQVIISLIKSGRSFLAFGASGVNGRINFGETDLSLAEAVAQAGGLVDARANPSQVFLYRVVGRAVAQRFGVDVTRYQGLYIPIIFRANFSDPASFFAAQYFPMRDKDIIYVSNAKSVQLLKFVRVINAVAVLPVTGAAIRDGWQ
jgi:protein involved in polysaccharide export with SLBB domain